jgi:hypothetical protein
MVKPAKSQWEFGDLFEKGPVRQVWSVAQITTKIRELLETELGSRERPLTYASRAAATPISR